MADIRQQIEDILVKDLPSSETCHHCEREIELDYDLDQVVDDLANLIGKEVKTRCGQSGKEVLTSGW